MTLSFIKGPLTGNFCTIVKETANCSLRRHASTALMFTIDNLLSKPDSVRKDGTEDPSSPTPGRTGTDSAPPEPDISQWAHLPPLLTAGAPTDPVTSYSSAFPLLPFPTAATNGVPSNPAMSYAGPSTEDPMNIASWLYSSDMSILRNSLLSFGGEELFE